MPAPITEFVDVTINVGGAVADKFSFNALLGAFDHSVTANRQDGPYTSIEEVNTAGFTSGAEPAVNAWATAALSQQNGVDEILIGRIDVGDADATESLDEIELAGSDTFYLLNYETRTDADIALIGAWAEARRKLAIVQSSDLTAVAAIALQGNSYNRTALIYHDDDTEYLDGAWSSKGGGYNIDIPGGRGVWGYQTLSGVPFDALTSAEASALLAANANFYGRNLGLNFTHPGVLASGRYIDTQVTIDWISRRTEEAVLAAFVNADVIPYTNAGINTLVGVVSGVMTQGQNFGHISTDVEPRIIAPDVSQVSAADRANRVLTLTVEVTLAGGIQQLVLTVNVTL